MKPGKLEGGLGVALLALVVGLGLSISFLREDAKPPSGSVASPAPDGRGALLAMLTELGVPAREWRDAPNRLPRKPALLWLPRVPSEDAPEAESGRGRRGASPPRTGLHSLDHYLAFVEAGGTILMPAGPEAERFLIDDLAIDEAPVASESSTDAGVTRRVTSSGGETFDVVLGTRRTFEPLDPNGTVRALWTVDVDGSTEPFVVSVPVGAGTIALIADMDFADNQRIGEAQNALTAVRLVEELDHGGAVLFGEYELGRWDSPSTFALAFSPTMLLVTLHGIALLVLLTWNRSYARAFPRDPEPHELFSPVQRARSLSGAFERAGRHAALARMLRRGSFQRLEASARVRAQRISSDARSNAPTDASLAPLRAEDVHAFAARAAIPDLAPRMEELLVARRVATREELDTLDVDLRALELAVERRTRTRDVESAHHDHDHDGAVDARGAQSADGAPRPTSPPLHESRGHSRSTETP